MGAQSERPQGAVWLQPGNYSLWAYDRGQPEPILVAAYEWERAGLRAVRPECVFFGEEDDLARSWGSGHPGHRELDRLESEIGGGAEASVFASLIEQGKVKRIGILPAIGRFADPPGWLKDDESAGVDHGQ